MSLKRQGEGESNKTMYSITVVGYLCVLLSEMFSSGLSSQDFPTLAKVVRPLFNNHKLACQSLLHTAFSHQALCQQSTEQCGHLPDSVWDNYHKRHHHFSTHFITTFHQAMTDANKGIQCHNASSWEFNRIYTGKVMKGIKPLLSAISTFMFTRFTNLHWKIIGLYVYFQSKGSHVSHCHMYISNWHR